MHLLDHERARGVLPEVCKLSFAKKLNSNQEQLIALFSESRV